MTAPLISIPERTLVGISGSRSTRALAEVVAHLVNFSSPGVLVLGGGALRTGARLVELISTAVMTRCTDLVTRDLVIRPASLDQLEGVIGAGLLAGSDLLAPASLAQWAESGTPLGHAADLQRLSAEVP